MTVNDSKLIRAFIDETGIETSYCPHCETDKPLAFFGTRVVNGNRIPQSWCRKCRRDSEREKREEARYAKLHANVAL